MNDTYELACRRCGTAMVLQREGVWIHTFAIAFDKDGLMVDETERVPVTTGPHRYSVVCPNCLALVPLGEAMEDHEGVIADLEGKLALKGMETGTEEVG